MIFSELYSAYYNAVAAILRIAVSSPSQSITADEIRSVVERHTFGESILSIPDSLRGEKWQLLKADGTTPIKNPPQMPLTKLQKRWLKAIAMDERIRLFTDADFDFPDVDPLFLPEDFCVFDKYRDGDDYASEAYRATFRLILDAIKNRCPLDVELENRRGSSRRKQIILPHHLEYSEKDDKFRVVFTGGKSGDTINLGDIIRCGRHEGEFQPESENENSPDNKPSNSSLVFELYDERKALERVLLHFAHLKKQVERLDGKKYRVEFFYDKDDEPELVTRLLSFGPMVKAIAPDNFVELTKKRLVLQKKLGI